MCGSGGSGGSVLIDDKRGQITGEMDDVLFLDLETGQQFLLQYIGLIEEQNQMDMSQEGAGTYGIECLERVVDPVHLGTRVSGPVGIRMDDGARMPPITALCSCHSVLVTGLPSK
jgi:hypothetical protein